MRKTNETWRREEQINASIQRTDVEWRHWKLQDLHDVRAYRAARIEFA
jgi:hypothetical protein